MKSLEPIFIVGPPRSGTTLLSAFLSSHSRLCCGPETHFYNKFVKTFHSTHGANYAKDWPHNAVDVFASLKLSGRSILALYKIDKRTLARAMSHKEAKASSVLSSMMELYCLSKQKEQWVEKTPMHLSHVKQIRQDFPNAKIIRIVRDARDVAKSMKKLPWAYGSVMANACLIDNWHQQSHAFFVQDKNSTSIKFEDLISEPESVLSTMCLDLGIPFEPSMLDRAETKDLANFDDEPWKKDILSTINANKAYAWRQMSNTEENSAIESTCRGYQETFAYIDSHSNKKNIESLSELSLIQVRESRFLGLDQFASRFVSSNYVLKQKTDNTNHYFLFFEASHKANIKLTLKGLGFKLLHKKKVYFLRQDRHAFLALLARFLFIELSCSD